MPWSKAALTLFMLSRTWSRWRRLLGNLPRTASLRALLAAFCWVSMLTTVGLAPNWSSTSFWATMSVMKVDICALVFVVWSRTWRLSKARSSVDVRTVLVASFMACSATAPFCSTTVTVRLSCAVSALTDVSMLVKAPPMGVKAPVMMLACLDERMGVAVTTPPAARRARTEDLSVVCILMVLKGGILGKKRNQKKLKEAGQVAT